MTLWLLQTRISHNLLLWSALSMLGGAPLILFLTPFWQGVGVQSVVWGVIDAGIALFGLYTIRRKRARPETNTPQVLRREARALRRLLLVNVGLDVFYVVAGVIVLLTFDTPFAHGNGVGVLVQGGFLLLFDTFYTTKVKID